MQIDEEVNGKYEVLRIYAALFCRKTAGIRDLCLEKMLYDNNFRCAAAKVCKKNI